MSEQQSIASELIEGIRKNARMAVIIGILMVICGVLSIASPLAAGVYVTIFVGVMLALSGISECFLAFLAGAFGRGLLLFIIGALTAIAGFYLLSQPAAGLAAITIFLAAYFIVTGIFEGVRVATRSAT